MELTEKYFMETVGWKAMKEAKALVESRKVLNATWKDPILRGLVQAGGRDYACGFNFKNPKDIENLCRCRESREWGQLCHHSVAIGLEIIRKADFHAGRLAPGMRGTEPAPMDPLLQGSIEKVKVNLLERMDNPEGCEWMKLSLIFAPNWLEQLEKGGRVSVTLYAETDKGRSLLGAVTDPGPWFLEEVDHRLINGLEELGLQSLPSHLTLESSQFLALAGELSGHMDIQQGKSGKVFVSDKPWIPECRLVANADGSLILEKSPTGEEADFTLLMGPPPWVFVGRKLRPVSPAASQWNWNAPQHKIPRGQVGKFLNHQWSDLEATGQVESQVDPAEFEIVTGQPEFHLQLEGGLARLQARLRCRYGVSFHTLNSRSDESKLAMGDWIADESHPFRYWTRDSAQEKQAVDLLMRAGFTRTADDGLMEMRSQDVVLPFFASHYQELKRKKWIIELDARLESSLDKKLEHIEPGFQFMSSGEDWFEMNLEYASAAGGKFTETDIHDMLRSGKSWKKKADGNFLMINAPLVEEFNEVLRDCSPTRHGQNFRFHARQAPFLSESIRESSGWKSVGNLNEDWHSKASQIPLPPDAQKILRDYQRHGVNWMMNLGQRMLGGILADDMGLGKTLQTLTMIRMLRSARSGPTSPTLVICPTSLVFNWEAEAAKFAPDLTVLALHGPKRESLFPQIIHHDLVITSFALIQRDIDHYIDHDFESVLVDEAQNIKNPKSRSAQAIRRLRSRNRFALTGTPIENRILDLWSVMDFVMPGYLGDMKDFQMRYEAPIAKLKDATVAERLRRRFKPFILRRLKCDVAKELPEKIDQLRLCEMSQDQASLYRSILNSSREKISNAVKSSGFARNQFLILQTLTRLRQVCCDVRLLGADDRLQKTLTAKFELFQEILEEALDGGHKVLVFSQFTSMLALLEEWLKEKEVGYSLLQGSTRQRQKVIDGFRHDDQKKVFLISLKAGGTGLNLTEADVVIHYDPWWNPAIEDQATSRAHRIGQRSVVTSYKLITKGTIEEKIVHLQQKKRELFQSMVDESAISADNLSWDDVQDLLDDSNL